MYKFDILKPISSKDIKRLDSVDTILKGLVKDLGFSSVAEFEKHNPGARAAITKIYNANTGVRMGGSIGQVPNLVMKDYIEAHSEEAAKRTAERAGYTIIGGGPLPKAEVEKRAIDPVDPVKTEPEPTPKSTVVDPKTRLTFEQAQKQGVKWTAPTGAYDTSTNIPTTTPPSVSTQGTTTPKAAEQQRLYDQAVAAGSSHQAALNAVRLIPGGDPNFTPGAAGTAPGGIDTGGLPPEYRTGNDILDEILNIMVNMFDELTAREQSVNPNIEITPEKAAEFMKQAEQEINPYYQTQLKMAREGFLSSLGYTRNEVIRFEEDLSKKFQTGHRQLGESAAEQGFALSGTRRRDEREMAEAAQRQAEDVRSRVAQRTEQEARQLASEWGPGAVEPLKWGEMPTFTPSGQVIGGSRELPAFQLGSAFTDLIGSKEEERRGAIKEYASELEKAEREQLLVGEMRKLNL